jgi:regulator of sigma E protease
VSANSPAEQAGLQENDLIVAVNGVAVDSQEKLVELVQASLEQPTEITYLRNEQTGTVTLVPRRNPPDNQGAIGIALGNQTRPISFTTAIARGVQGSYEYGKTLLLLPLRILQGEATPEEGRPVGFKGMFDIYQQIPDPLFFFMAIAISLGIFNLLPIPALDGGRILLTLPEILIRRRIPPQYENMIHLVGFALLLILIIYINLQDFINPLTFPN